MVRIERNISAILRTTINRYVSIIADRAESQNTYSKQITAKYSEIFFCYTLAKPIILKNSRHHSGVIAQMAILRHVHRDTKYK